MDLPEAVKVAALKTIGLLCVLAIATTGLNAAAAEEPGPAERIDPAKKEGLHLRNIRQVTYVGSKNGEAYFSPDGRDIVFQGVREPGNPFYQIYRMDLSTGQSMRVSPGTGRTTCAFFHPQKSRILYASTHLDKDSVDKQKQETERLKSAPPKRYNWDFDPFFDVFEADLGGGNLVRLTDADGYDAECSYSPDGSRIVFCSTRDGGDPEIYIMDSDGKNQKRLTEQKGYDGGPFFSPDGKRIIWRHFDDAHQKVAEVWTMSIDGTDKQQVTKLNSLSWAPFYHPSMKWIVFSSNVDDPSFDLYAIKPDGKELTRLTWTPNFDGLPVFSHDGHQLMWTSNRTENKSQIFMADVTLPEVEPPADKRDTATGAYIDPLTLRSTAQKVADAGLANKIEHHIAKQFIAVHLPPLRVRGAFEETQYIQGPSVVGLHAPRKDETGVLIVSGEMHLNHNKAVGLGGLLEILKIVDNDRDVEPEAPLCGLLASAANGDALLRLPTFAVSALKFANAEKKYKTMGYISLSNLGHINDNKLYIRGVGTSPAWRELFERVSARHPTLQVVLVDDPAGVAELKPFVEQKLPCVAFGGADPLENGQAEREAIALEAGVCANAAAFAVDCIRLITKREIQLPFSEYDAAAAKAAAGATQRPYLGTIPDYKAAGGDGVGLTGVREASPAEKAGLAAGDVIVALNGMEIKDVEGYLKALESLTVGTETNIKIKRGDAVKVLKITPGAR